MKWEFWWLEGRPVFSGRDESDVQRETEMKERGM